ncbi:MAG: hypothetical protein ACYSWR_06760 [Planctomycetota bacterium]|jgi:hypothetical protein
MKKLLNTKRTIKFKPTIHSQLDSHKWATKMEVHHLLSGKRDLKLKEVEKQAV